MIKHLGIIGAGFARFWDAFDKSGRHFSPDLVVVNYLNLDLPRGRRIHLRTEEEMLAEAPAWKRGQDSRPLFRQ